MSIPCVVVICDNVVENVFQCEDGNHAERLFLSLVTKAFKKEPWPKSEQEALDDGFVDTPEDRFAFFGQQHRKTTKKSMSKTVAIHVKKSSA